jgi:hypothetical protein
MHNGKNVPHQTTTLNRERPQETQTTLSTRQKQNTEQKTKKMNTTDHTKKPDKYRMIERAF